MHKGPMTNHKPHRIRLAAVGDLLFTNRPGCINPGRGLEALSNDIKELFKSCNVVFANLEATFPGPQMVPTEPRLVANLRQIQSLRDSGINMVTLANNHAFDCLDEGFHRLRDVLDDLGIPWFGAGDNFEEAFRPVILDVGGISFAFLGVVDESSAPSHFAGKSTRGVAPLDTEIVCLKIKELRGQVDHVILAPHWGEERFRLPSPEQVDQAHTFVDAGASMVLGHHPHVLQGVEIYRGAPIAYSLGNFLANRVYWSDGGFLNWDRSGRTGCIIVAEVDVKGVQEFQQVLTFDDGKNIQIDSSGWGGRYLKKVNGFLVRGVTPKRYQREGFYVRNIWPVYSHLRWSELRRIRPRHFRKAFHRLLRMGE